MNEETGWKTVLRKLGSRKFVVALVGTAVAILALALPEYESELVRAGSRVAAALLSAGLLWRYIAAEAAVDRAREERREQ